LEKGGVQNGVFWCDMIQLSNGHSFEFMAASGALGFDGQGWPWEQPLRLVGLFKPELFTVVVKSLTLKPRKGNLLWYNPLRCVRLISDGVVNAVGLTNPGIDWWIKEMYPRVVVGELNVVASIAGESLQENMEMALKLKSCDKIKGLEINASCPNSPGELQSSNQAVIDTAQALKYVTKWPLIVKLSCVHDYVKIAKALEGTVEAISINSVPWTTMFEGKKSSLERFGGGAVSGKRAQAYTWKMVSELAQSTSIPVIGASVWEYQDIGKLFDMGAKAVAFGSIFLRYPWRPTHFVKRWLSIHRKTR